MFKNKLQIYGDQNIQVPAHLNFGKYMLDRLRCMGDEIAMKDTETDEKLTYKELTHLAVKAAAALTAVGVRRGDIVGLGCERHILFIPAALGIIFTGAAYTAFGNNWGKSHLEHLMEITKPKYIICNELFLETNEQALSNPKIKCKIIKLEELFSSANNLDVDSFEPNPVNGQVDTAIVSYTSGTTGWSKGVQATHLNCIIYSSPDEPRFIEDSLKTVFIIDDLTSTYCVFIAYKMLALGKTFVFGNTNTPDKLLTTFEKEKVNAAVLEPSIINLILKTELKRAYKLESLKCVYSAAYKLPVKATKELKEMFPSISQILQGYGMTETHFLASETCTGKPSRVGSAGLVCPGIILKIVNPETNVSLGPNEPGLICVKGPAVMKGYMNADHSTYFDEEGWFRTGDIGQYDTDKFVYIIGRMKQIIKYLGYTVSPLELESILLVHPGVLEAGVVGKPDPINGEVPTAFVVRQPGSKVTEQELVDYVATEMPWYMQLCGGVKFITELPRSPRGKILYKNLLEMMN